MNTYLVVFDCMVIDEPYIKFIKAHSAQECWEIAYPISMGTGLSAGNFEIYKHIVEFEEE